VTVKPDSKIRKCLRIAGLMLAGFILAFLAGRSARNDLAALAPPYVEIPASPLAPPELEKPASPSHSGESGPPAVGADK
jgi:hypothetical protein